MSSRLVHFRAGFAQLSKAKSDRTRDLPGSSNMPAILDLRVQLADRVKRSKALIEFINANGLLGKVRPPLNRLQVKLIRLTRGTRTRSFLGRLVSS